MGVMEMGLKKNWWIDLFAILLVALAIGVFMRAKAEDAVPQAQPGSPAKVEWKQAEMTDLEGNPVKVLYAEVKVSIQEACKKEGESAWQEAVTKAAEAWVNEHAESEKLTGLDIKLGLPSLPCNIVGKDGILTFAIARPAQ
ncbi:hypothetical protein HYT05_01730 [Candidatus Kaiserbacteria bacterium]|nr:hypothetical protein [Candidatus Kaiserbacteria bacterium]